MKDQADLKGISASWNEIAKEMLEDEFFADFDPNSGKEGKYHKFSCPMCSDGDKLKEAYAYADKAVFINCPRDNHCSYSVKSGNDINLRELFPDRFPKDPNYKPPPKKKIKPAKNELDGIRKISKGEKLSEKEKELIKLEKSGTPLEYFTALKVTQACFYKGDSTWFGWTVEKEGQEPKKFVRLILDKRIEREFIFRVEDKQGKHFGYDYFTGMKFGNHSFIIPNQYFGDVGQFNRFINQRNSSCKSGVDRKCFYDLNILIKNKEVKEIEKINYIGKVAPGSFVFPHFMVKDGELYRKEGIYIPGANVIPLDLRGYTENVDEDFNVRVIGDYVYDTWGPKGVLAFGYVAANLFEECFSKKGILSLTGERNSGKSTLADRLSLAFKFSQNSVPNLVSTSSKAGIHRKMAGIRGVLHYFSEANKVEGQKFQPILDENELLRFYDKDLFRTKGIQNDGMEYKEDEISGGMIFAQNDEFWTRPANRERVISFHFKNSDITPNTKTAITKLKAITREQLANLGVTLMKNYSEIVEKIPEFSNEVRKIYKDLSERQFEVHGQALVGVKILEQFCNWHTFPVQQFSLTTAKENFTNADQSNDLVQEIIGSILEEYKTSTSLEQFTQPDTKERAVYFNLSRYLGGNPREREIKALFKSSGTYKQKWFSGIGLNVRSWGIPFDKIEPGHLNIILQRHGINFGIVKC